MLLKLIEKLAELGSIINKTVIYSPLVVLKQVQSREICKTAEVSGSNICWTLIMTKYKNP